MTKFKDLFLEKAFNKKMDDASVSVSLKENQLTLFLRFDSKDNIIAATYEGKASPWFTSMCFLITGKNLNEAMKLNWSQWDEAFKSDQNYWDMKQEVSSDFLNPALELLKAALDTYRGRDYLYKNESPLICRCFGIRESDILEHLQKTELPTLESLTGDTKAGMGCRTCVPQLKRWVALHETKNFKHYYKEKPNSEWLLEIDYMLSCFPEAQDWKMEVQSMKNGQVLISFDKNVSQLEEEEIGKRLQGFLGASLDTGLAYFLRRARHFSNANG